jgi:hypothetical protein
VRQSDGEHLLRRSPVSQSETERENAEKDAQPSALESKVGHPHLIAESESACVRENEGKDEVQVQKDEHTLDSCMPLSDQLQVLCERMLAHERTNRRALQCVQHIQLVQQGFRVGTGRVCARLGVSESERA